MLTMEECDPLRFFTFTFTFFASLSDAFFGFLVHRFGMLKLIFEPCPDSDALFLVVDLNGFNND